jgi:hypothetical protein
VNFNSAKKTCLADAELLTRQAKFWGVWVTTSSLQLFLLAFSRIS